MPTGKPKVGVVYRSAGAPVDPPKCIPAKAYERKYFVSLSQIKRLLAKKLLCGVRYKRRLFIEDVPPPL
ncbi:MULTISPECIES: hypothetical protein [unclassified Microcoleus]|uniref:hypothetical protein n=1 Tax=unclassified Microcoleus TaxID=2642155 RepID=UPI002FCF97E7